MKRKMVYFVLITGLIVGGIFAWNLTARAAYESAEYKVLQTSGKIEIREYPDLTLVSTSTELDAQGNDGSFMRLFRYISGNNDENKKIAMTTPVFMEGKSDDAIVSMGFVMPKEIASDGAPDPMASGVEIKTRKGGRFAVIRFAGRIDSQLARTKEKELRVWMETQRIEGEAVAEVAGYDPPFTPSPLRRNEVLIRLKSKPSDLGGQAEPSPVDDQP